MGKSFTVRLIVPYFGKLPMHFPLLLKQCAENSEFEWLIITDDTRRFDCPPNVKIVFKSLLELRAEWEEKLGFATSLERPYKLCDFRPLYGWLLQEYLTKYTHWGYCDLDLLFGKLGNFITPEYLEQYDKISVLGHLSILRNDPEINKSFMQCDFKSILQDSRSRIFDEVRFHPNINEILKTQGFQIKETIPYADIDPQHYSFGLYRYFSGSRATALPRKPLIFEYCRGRMFAWELDGNELKKTEYAYVHFQKRKVAVETEDDEFLLVPNKICRHQQVNREIILQNSQDSVSYTIQNKIKRIQNAWRVRVGQ